VPQTGGRLPDPSAGVGLWTEGPLRKVYPTDVPPQQQAEGLDLAAAGGECDVAQICLRSDRAIPGLSAQFSALLGPGQLPSETLSGDFVGLVNVAYPTSGRGITGPTPDPLLTDSAIELPAGQTRSLLVTARVPADTPAGDYTAQVTLSAEGFSATVPIKLRVYAFDLPPTPTLTTIARIWDQHKGYEDLFLQALEDHRCSGASYIGGLGVSVKDGQVVVDTSKFADAVQSKLRAHNFHVFNAPSVFLGDASGFYAKDGKWNGFALLSPEFDEAFESYCRQLAQAFREQGVMQDAIWQVWDEPQNDEMMKTCVHLASLVKRAAPDARVYLTSGVKRELLDLVSIWCLPWPSCYADQEAKQAREHGAVLWAYDNSLYASDVADSSLLLRHYPWQLKRYGIEGVEWWAVSQWKKDPWTVANPYSPQNGGGFFLYPTPDRKGAPVSSLRFVMYREGVEDYDLLSLYEKEQDRALESLGVEDARLSGAAQVLELCARVAPGPDAVSPDPRIADSLRRSVAERIELLRMEPPVALGTVRGQEENRLLVAAGDAQVTIDGEAVTGGVIERPMAEGTTVTVGITRGGLTRTITVR